MSRSGNPIRRALVSVSDKTHLGRLAEILREHEVEVLSTGGTFEALTKLGLSAVRVADYTGAPEILDGRVKTLHPKIHGGILALPTAAHQGELEKHEILPIDVVVVNLYPFEATIQRDDCTFEDAVENIDIGGPTMVRAAAKNWSRVAVIVDPNDYALLGEALGAGGGALDDEFRRAMSRKAFAHTASYDAAIANYLASRDDTGEPAPGAAVASTLAIAGRAMSDLRYGENPHQSARWFGCDYLSGQGGGLDRAIQHQGKELSYNNLLDADAALALIRDLKVLGQAAAVFKHLCPCGAAIAEPGESLANTYRRAREADSESAFGGIVAVTGAVDGDLAEVLAETFLEVIVAPSYTTAARERLGRKSKLRLLEVPDMFVAEEGPAPVRVRSVAGGLLVQREDRINVAAHDAKRASARTPTDGEVTAMDFAQRVGKHVRSNAIVVVRGTVTVGIGGGQTSRVEAVRQALTRAGEEAKGAVLASDAFFPFRDSIDTAAGAGIVGVIQPGGSVRDEEVIAAADEHGISMLFTGERHFRH